jgi:hypothetical protein
VVCRCVSNRIEVRKSKRIVVILATYCQIKRQQEVKACSYTGNNIIKDIEGKNRQKDRDGDSGDDRDDGDLTS